MNTIDNAPETLVEKTTVTMSIEFEIISFEKRVTTDEVLEEMRRRELTPADSMMLEAFVKGYQGVGDLNQLTALGDPQLRLVKEHSYSRCATIPLMEVTKYVARSKYSSEPIFHRTDRAWGWAGRKEEAADYAKFLAYRLLTSPQ